ncbi:MAG: response regulator, partial [Myxococcota bacterium]
MKRGLPEDGTALPPMAVEGSTILIVDDSSDSRYLLSSLLEGNGFRVLSAPNGAEALKLAREQRPDLVISDILMPIMDGFELCRRWRGDESLRAVPFVFHTATYTEPEDESLGRELGADRFLMKPQQPERLLEVVNEVLEETRTRDTSADGSRAEERELLLQHNQVLFRKLQKKIEDLEQQIAERDRLEQERKRAEEERERLRDQLVVSQKMEAIGRLAGGVAHDFNNLLLVISSYTDMTSGSLPEDHTLQSNLSEIAKAADRAAALTRQLLAFSRRQMLEPRAVDLGALVRGMRSMMGRLLGEDIDVAVREPSEPLVTLGDPGQLEQVVMNLAVNAREAMPRGGK